MAGALLNSLASSPALGFVLAALLIFVGISGLTGFSQRMKFEGAWAWAAGAVSGFLGGLVGNQGGLRSGAMLGLDVSRHAFVATATATGLIVDFARMPVYVSLQYHALVDQWRPLAIACLGVLVGTVVGARVLRKLPEKVFRSLVAVLLLGLGVWILVSQLTAPPRSAGTLPANRRSTAGVSPASGKPGSGPTRGWIGDVGGT